MISAKKLRMLLKSFLFNPITKLDIPITQPKYHFVKPHTSFKVYNLSFPGQKMRLD